MNETNGREQHVTTLKTLLFSCEFIPVLQEIFRLHGGLLEVSGEYCVATFPAGTRKVELLPRVRKPRYWITFSDGYLIYEVYNICSQLSHLYFPEVDIPVLLREAYKKFYAL